MGWGLVWDGGFAVFLFERLQSLAVDGLVGGKIRSSWQLKAHKRAHATSAISCGRSTGDPVGHLAFWGTKVGHFGNCLCTDPGAE